ncbi:MAG: response regulator, partial [Syntrophobacteraceae bacterium]
MDNSLKILLIEDDKEDYLIIRQLISEVRSAKFYLDWVATFDEGLDAIRRNAHDVYLLDYRLGDKDGLELARETFANAHKPVLIMLTGHDDQSLDIQAIQTGAADFLVKSMLREDILERSIRHAIERKTAERALEAEIDKRKKIEEALRLDEMRLEALWELSKMSQASDET